MPDAAALRPVNEPAAWTGADMAQSDEWLIQLDEHAADEIWSAAVRADALGHSLLALDRDDFELPTLTPRLAEIRRELLYGRGFCVLRGLTPDPANKRLTALAFWAVGMHLGDEALSQNAKGHALGHIQDIGQSRGNVLQRGPYSREGIPYHCDACDIVGLFCLHPARSGGASTVASSVAVFNALVDQRPELAAALMEPIYRDRRGEIPPGMDEWYAIPIFNLFEGWFSANMEPTYIGSAERFDEVPRKTDLQREAIEETQRLAAELHLSMDFRQGDMQFINNHVIFHSRTGYEEFPEPERKRHLLRLWLKCRDGRPLPHWFYDRHGRPGTVDRPGGIVGHDTTLCAPLEAC